jgi:hypothetical protein
MNGVLEAVEHSSLLALEMGVIKIRRFSIYQYFYIEIKFLVSRKKETYKKTMVYDDITLFFIM